MQLKRQKTLQVSVVAPGVLQEKRLGINSVRFTPPAPSPKSSVAPWLIAGIAYCCRRRRIKNGSPPSTVWVANPPSYRPIHEPSPQAAYEVHMTPGAPPGYTPMYVPEYKTAWDARY